MLDQVLEREPEHQAARELRERLLRKAEESAQVDGAGEGEAAPEAAGSADAEQGAPAVEPEEELAVDAAAGPSQAEGEISAEVVHAEPSEPDEVSEEPLQVAEEAEAAEAGVGEEAVEAGAEQEPSEPDEASEEPAPTDAVAETLEMAFEERSVEPVRELEPSAASSAEEAVSTAQQERPAADLQHTLADQAGAGDEVASEPELDALLWWSDAQGIHLYWELTTATFDRTREDADVELLIQLVGIVAQRDGNQRLERQVCVDSRSGRATIDPLPPGTFARAALGLRSGADFVPLVIGAAVATSKENDAQPFEWLSLEYSRLAEVPEGLRAARRRALGEATASG
jgi:hypothetical protein